MVAQSKTNIREKLYVNTTTMPAWAMPAWAMPAPKATPAPLPEWAKPTPTPLPEWAKPAPTVPQQSLDYILNGWKLCSIPGGAKGPTTPGWNINPVTNPANLTGNVGLLHGLSGTCSIDIDNLSWAKRWLTENGIDLQALLDAPDAVQITSGREGSAKLLYALPAFLAMPTKKIVIKTVTTLEFRCIAVNGHSVQDVLPPSKHPSGTTYAWAGAGDWTKLPPLPMALQLLWSNLVARSESLPPPEAYEDASKPITNYEELMSAVNTLDHNCDHDTWVKIGMALHSVNSGSKGFTIWRDWSRKSIIKYPGDPTMDKRWKSFKATPTGVTVATIYDLAYKAGWVPPTPDLTKMFSAVTEEGMAKTTPEAAENRFAGQMSAPPTTDLSLWPQALVRRAQEVATEVGCDVIVPLTAGLCALSGATDKRSRLLVNGTWTVPPNVWMMTVGEPADKKTPGSKPMIKPLHAIERENLKKHAADMLLWEGKEARYTAELKAYKSWSESDESQLPNSMPPNVTPLPPKPEPLRLVISDATTQKMVMMAENRPAGFLLHLDEMNRWLTRLGDARSTDDRGAWIQGYESGPFSMDRIGSGSTMVEHLGISLYGNCQPEVFRSNVKQASSDGLIQRFMPVVINPKNNVMWQDSIPADQSHEGEYEQLLRSVYAHGEHSYTLSEEARTVFKAFSKYCLEIRDDERILESNNTYQTALGKLEGNFCRMALMFHIIENKDNSVVSGELMMRVMKLFKTFIVPSLRYTYMEVGQQSDPLARHIFRVIVQSAGMKATMTLAEIKSALPSTYEQNREPWKFEQLIRAHMAEMEVAGYAMMHQDHPRTPVWAINPKLSRVFDEYRRKIIASQNRSVQNIEDRKALFHPAGVPSHKVNTARGIESWMGITPTTVH